MGEGMAYGVLPFQDIGCPVPDVDIYYVSDITNIRETVSTFIQLP